MGNRGKFMAVVIDDGTAQVEMTVYEDVFEQYRSSFREDELLVAKIQIKVTPAQENFSGSTRIICQAAMNIATARLRFAKSLHLQLQDGINLKELQDRAKPYLLAFQNKPVGPTGATQNLSGLIITADVISDNSACQVQFPDSWRLYPDDANLQGFSAALSIAGSQAPAEIKYV